MSNTSIAEAAMCSVDVLLQYHERHEPDFCSNIKMWIEHVFEQIEFVKALQGITSLKNGYNGHCWTVYRVLFKDILKREVEYLNRVLTSIKAIDLNKTNLLNDINEICRCIEGVTVSVYSQSYNDVVCGNHELEVQIKLESD